jgi:hypothetical protein
MPRVPAPRTAFALERYPMAGMDVVLGSTSPASAMAGRPRVPKDERPHAPRAARIASRATGRKVLLVFSVIVIFCSIVAHQ